MSTYEYRVHENDALSEKIIVLGNSKTENYVLRIIIKDNKISYESIIDFTKNEDFPIHNLNESLEINNLVVDKGHLLDVKKCDDRTNEYVVEYTTVGDVKAIKIIRYKNKKRKKIINECIIYTKPSETTKNHHFSFPQLMFPLRCGKFKLENEELLSQVKFIENNKEVHFYKLIDFKSIDLKIKI